MLIKALTSFAGVVSMAQNEVREVDDAIAADLIRAGLAEREKTNETKRDNNKRG